ncbi:hypothetical protein D3C87_22030 [compost metagenome]
MIRFLITPFLLAVFFVSGCRKENGKREYEIQLFFDNGEYYKNEGTITEKMPKVNKYHGDALYTTFFNDYYFLKVNDKLISSGQLIIINGNNGDIYFEGAYTRKGRAYIVEDGYFEVIWRDNAGDPLTNSVLTGKWTLKRK